MWFSVPASSSSISSFERYIYIYICTKKKSALTCASLAVASVLFGRHGTVQLRKDGGLEGVRLALKGAEGGRAVLVASLSPSSFLLDGLGQAAADTQTQTTAVGHGRQRR